MAVTPFQRDICLLLEVRDWVDVILCDERVQPFGCLAWAACGKDPGFTPQGLIVHAGQRQGLPILRQESATDGSRLVTPLSRFREMPLLRLLPSRVVSRVRDGAIVILAEPMAPEPMTRDA